MGPGLEKLTRECDFEVEANEPIRVWRAVDGDIERLSVAIRGAALEEAARFLDQMALEIPLEALGGKLRMLPLAYAGDLRRMK